MITVVVNIPPLTKKQQQKERIIKITSLIHLIMEERRTGRVLRYPSAYAMAKREFGLLGKREDVIEQLELLIR